MGELLTKCKKVRKVAYIQRKAEIDHALKSKPVSLLLSLPGNNLQQKCSLHYLTFSCKLNVSSEIEKKRLTSLKIFDPQFTNDLATAADLDLEHLSEMSNLASKLGQTWVRLAPNGTNLGVFKINFSTFWLILSHFDILKKQNYLLSKSLLQTKELFELISSN